MTETPSDPACVCEGTGRVIQGSSGESTPCPYCCADELRRLKEASEAVAVVWTRTSEAVHCADIACRIIEQHAAAGTVATAYECLEALTARRDELQAESERLANDIRRSTDAFAQR